MKVDTKKSGLDIFIFLLQVLFISAVIAILIKIGYSIGKQNMWIEAYKNGHAEKSITPTDSVEYQWKK